MKSLAQSHVASKDGGGTGTLTVMHLVTWGEEDWGPPALTKVHTAVEGRTLVTGPSALSLPFRFCLITPGQPHLVPRGSVTRHPGGLLAVVSRLSAEMHSAMCLNYGFSPSCLREAGAFHRLQAGMVEGTGSFTAQWKAPIPTRTCTSGQS